MKLADYCVRGFDAAVRSRGNLVYRSGRVTILVADEQGVEAEVQGSRRMPYEVLLDLQQFERGSVTGSCTCAYYLGGSLCKHIWAVLLAVDRDQLAEGGGASSRFGDARSADRVNGSRRAGSRNRRIAQSAQTATLGAEGRQRARRSSWRDRLAALGCAAGQPESIDQIWHRVAGKRREAWYLLDVAESLVAGHLVVELLYRETKKDGQFGKARQLRRTHSALRLFTSEEDRNLVELLIGISSETMYYGWGSYHNQASQVRVAAKQHELVLPRMCGTGRFRWRLSSGAPEEDSHPIAWDAGPPYHFRLKMIPVAGEEEWIVEGLLAREDERVPLAEPVLLISSGVVLFADRLARLDAADAFPWIVLLRKDGEIRIPGADRWDFLEMVHASPARIEVELPDSCRIPQVAANPHPTLRVRKPEGRADSPELHADLFFEYDGTAVAITDPRARILDRENERVVCRNRDQEWELLRRLSAWKVQPLGLRYRGTADFAFLEKDLEQIVYALTAEGWTVEAEGLRIRQPGAFSGSVTSGVDWFELDGRFDYGDGVAASLPDLLKAVQQGQNYVRLSDGSRGMLPTEWLARFSPLAEMAKPEDERLRFRNYQAMLLDALIAAQENVSVDRTFSTLREKLRSFDGVKPQREPRGFSGHLRDYQQEGLGWLHFLRSFGLGGCLADDMGLGKTIQVLAMLQAQRAGGRPQEPTLIVVPRSLVFNWIDEAARFAPRINFRNYTGFGRAEHLEHIAPGDVLVTTYGTLRRDILKLKPISFDCVVLDEAQAIKNPNSQAAKAARLLDARHRLALTGTPVENHLGELWSLFEFLNPGMLGRSSVFHRCWRNGQADPEKIELLRTALAPFLLRRTKQNVLTELPEKTEQTLYCELDGQERKSYDQLRRYYRDALQHRIEAQGLNQSKIQVLEALLRLRQAACHRGLLDPRHAERSSAKLETLLEQVEEVVAEGHKALVFSQFTSLLAIVKSHLDRRGFVYEYLDGSTRNRGEKVRRFQTDPQCPLFLISLKAGGHGLNLTAADYVFILDPWWNPAVEAQAVDRVHRIGQNRPVFAYRLIARDTVEEKILQLQASKRHLAEAIVSADAGLLQRLTAEDVQLLLS